MNIVSKKLLIVIPTIVILFVAVMLSDTIEKRIDDISETIMDDELIGDMEQQLESLTARIIVKGEEYKIKGYYSKSKEQWCIVIPAGYQDQKVFLEAKMTNGEKQTFSRIPSEGEMIFTWKDTHYPIDFIWANNIETLYVSYSHGHRLNLFCYLK